jgi:hypothetical protein
LWDGIPLGDMGGTKLMGASMLDLTGCNMDLYLIPDMLIGIKIRAVDQASQSK